MDTTIINNFFSQPTDQIILDLLLNLGWIPIALILLWGAKEIWMDYIQNKWGGANSNYILLAIDIPRGNEQSPKAVENIFTYLGGAHGTFNLIEKYWEGKFQQAFSLEIVSIEGYTQFLIRSPIQFRDLVESAFYSQYPDAEITEVNDYTENTPSKFPDDEYDIFGAEFIHANNEVYPIKMYKEFENQLSGKPETQFKDPMSSLMDLCSSLKKGEQFWYQIILKPTDFDWVKMGDKEISKILGEKSKSKTNIFDFFIDGILKIIEELSEMIFNLWGDIEDKKEDKKEDDALKMMNLKPKQKKQIEAIQEKVSKLGFLCKNRVVYLAKKDVFNKPKVFGGFVGYMKQFIDMDLNNLKPDMNTTATKAVYFFTKHRINIKKRKLMNAYKERSSSIGKTEKILNIEELATLWHFPVESVAKAPLIQKAPGRKAEPPMHLPILEEEADKKLFETEINEKNIFVDIPKNKQEQENKEYEEDKQQDIFELNNKDIKHKNNPPDNLPI